MTAITFPYQTIRDVDVAGKTVLMRADYNVPLNGDGSIADDYRIDMSLPTVKYLIDRGVKLVLISHLGRPRGQVNLKYSLAPVAVALSAKLKKPVTFIDDCVGEAVTAASDRMQPGDVILLQNLRFHAGEETNDRAFAEDLVRSSRANLFVQDGFGVVHRAHASTSAITEFLPSVAGLLLEREYVAIKSATDNPERPLTAVLGGAKISDKMPLVRRFINIADNVVIGGAMANNFLKYLGYNVADSLVEPAADDMVKQIIEEAQAKYGAAYDEHFVLPRDVAVSETGEMAAPRVELLPDRVGGSMKILDIGEKTMDAIDRLVESSKTVIWNGTLGMAEQTNFAHGSARLALALAKHPEITSVIGGGDTADFVRHWDARGGSSFTHVSTGGGASLELMAGDTLPGIAALMPKRY